MLVLHSTIKSDKLALKIVFFQWYFSITSSYSYSSPALRPFLNPGVSSFISYLSFTLLMANRENEMP